MKNTRLAALAIVAIALDSLGSCTSCAPPPPMPADAGTLSFDPAPGGIVPAIAIVTVNTATDTITANAHGLTTGDRFRMRIIGAGAFPTATPAFAQATDYFAVVQDANNLKASDTNAHALSGTNIVDITGVATASYTIEYGLPYSMPTVLPTAGGQIKSADVSAAWTSLVALYDLLTAQAQSIWTSLLLAVDLVMSANKSITVSGTGDFKHGDRVLTLVASAVGTVQSGTVSVSNDGSINYTAATVVLYGIPLRTGDRIKSVTFAATGNGTVDGDAQVFIVPSTAAAATNIGTTTLTNVSATKHDETVDCTDTTLGAGEAALVLIETSATGLTVGNIRVTYDRP